MKTALIIICIVINIISVAIAKQNVVPKEDSRRSWEKAKSIWGKRANNEPNWSMPVWGKRAPMHRLMFGKRLYGNGNDWQGAQGVWGKRGTFVSADSETQRKFSDFNV